MLACKNGVECHTLVHQQHLSTQLTTTTRSSHSTMKISKEGDAENPTCGSNFAYLYFCSFVFLSSFLVSALIRLKIKYIVFLSLFLFFLIP